jgi:hypothetical protein
MGNKDSRDTSPAAADNAGEAALRGADLKGPERKNAVDHTAYQIERNPDTLLRVDDEDDSLYTDGLEVEDDSETLADTRGANNKG